MTILSVFLWDLELITQDAFLMRYSREEGGGGELSLLVCLQRWKQDSNERIGFGGYN